MDLEKTKKILIRKAKTEYFKSYLFLDIDKKELKSFIEEIKSTKSKTKLDRITYNLFNY